MNQAFITSPDQIDCNGSGSKDITASTGKQAKLRQLIKNTIVAMPSFEICQQAAMNIGLSNNMCDFQKILKLTANEINSNSLNFTYLQLKALQKEAVKLKKSANLAESAIKQTHKYNIRRVNKRETLKLDEQEEVTRQQTSQQNLKAALQQQLANREKLKIFYSSDKLQKKQNQIKKKIQKAKIMNKKALKIYKNYKEKQEMSYDYFKIQPIYSPSMKTLQKTTELPPKLHQQKDVFQYQDLSKDSFHLKVSMFQDEVIVHQQKCRTAGTRRRARDYSSIPTSHDRKNSKDERFEEYKKRQLRTRQKRNQLEKMKQEQALCRLIRKQERISQLHAGDANLQDKTDKKMAKSPNQSLIKQMQNSVIASDDLEESIKIKCQEKQFKKQLQLQQKINRIREQFKKKQERMERHKTRQQKEHEQKLQMNDTYLRSFQNRYKNTKQNNRKHQLTIKTRYEQQKQKQNLNKHINKLSKLTDQQLHKSLQKINNKALFNSLLTLGLT